MKVFLHNQYVDTLGVIVEVGKEVTIRFEAQQVKAKIVEILPDGVMVEITPDAPEGGEK